MVGFLYNGCVLLKDKNHLKRQIQAIHKKYDTNYEVSERKNFVEYGAIEV
jgi:hypothetical protein